jgi:hypothetical protein
MRWDVGEGGLEWYGMFVACGSLMFVIYIYIYLAFDTRLGNRHGNHLGTYSRHTIVRYTQADAVPSVDGFRVAIV